MSEVELEQPQKSQTYSNHFRFTKITNIKKMIMEYSIPE